MRPSYCIKTRKQPLSIALQLSLKHTSVVMASIVGVLSKTMSLIGILWALMNREVREHLKFPLDRFYEYRVLT